MRSRSPGEGRDRHPGSRARRGPCSASRRELSADLPAFRRELDRIVKHVEDRPLRLLTVGQDAGLRRNLRSSRRMWRRPPGRLCAPWGIARISPSGIGISRMTCRPDSIAARSSISCVICCSVSTSVMTFSARGRSTLGSSPIRPASVSASKRRDVSGRAQFVRQVGDHVLTGPAQSLDLTDVLERHGHVPPRRIGPAPDAADPAGSACAPDPRARPSRGRRTPAAPGLGSGRTTSRWRRAPAGPRADSVARLA